jgi:hypothetical protein
VNADKERTDRNFYNLKTGPGLNTRVILRKTSPGGFGAILAVYDDVENRIAGETQVFSGDDSLSLAFRSKPNSYYFVKVESRIGAGPYELLIREE